MARGVFSGSMWRLRWLACLLVLVGCARRETTYPVQGRVVTRDGRPVTTGIVEFKSVSSGRIARGTLGPAGEFQLTTFLPQDGAVAGKHQVVVVQIILDQLAGVAIQHVHDHGPRIPPRYGDYGQSRLAAEVTATPDNAIEFVLEAASSESMQ